MTCRAWPFLDRQALACQHRLVHRGCALDHHAVNRHLVAGAHAHHVARLHLLQRHVDSSSPSRTTRAVRGARPISFLIASQVRPLARASS